jgi:tetratricopeptide (TPR) repeat protein
MTQDRRLEGEGKIMRISSILLAAVLTTAPAAAQITSRTPPGVINQAVNNSQWTLDYDRMRGASFNAEGFAFGRGELSLLRDLEKRIASGDLAKARVALSKAENAITSNDGKYVLGALQLQLADKANDDAMREKATDMVIAGGRAPAAMLPSLYRNQGVFALGRKDLAKADRAFSKLVELMPANPESLVILAQVKTDQGKLAEALPLFERAIAAQRASGQPVPEVWNTVAAGVRARLAKR